MHNRTCNYCGDEYYCCKSCISINSWKNVCCSQECFRKMITESDDNLQPIILEKGANNMISILRAGLVGGKTIDITGYDIELGKFDCTDGKTKVFEDFEYFIVPKDEMKAIGDKIQILSSKKIPTPKSEKAETEKTDV